MLAGASFASEYPMTTTDALGRNVTIASEPVRIVSLSPAITETIWMLGAGDFQVGRSDFCNHPSDVLKVKPVGGIINASVEEIALLNPDLVLVQQGTPKEIITQLERLDVTVVTFSLPCSLDEVLHQIGEIGRIIGREGEASLFIKEKSALMDAVEVSIQKSPERVRVYIGGHSAPFMTAGKGTFIDDLITRAGGINIATMPLEGVRTPDQAWPQLSPEQILLADPEIIVTAVDKGRMNTDSGCDFVSSLARDAVFSEVTAVLDGNILLIDQDVLLRPGPRIFDALDELAEYIRKVSGK